MRQKRPDRTSNQYYAFALAVPAASTDCHQLPRIKIQFDHYTLRGQHLDLLSIAQTITKIGIFTEDPKILDGRDPQELWPFASKHLRSLLMGDYDDEWVLYGFEVHAYALTLLYYNIMNPNRRGMVELGCNFDALQFSLMVPAQGATAAPKDVAESLSLETPTTQRLPNADFRYVVYLWRHPTTTTSIFKFLQRKYVECSATIARSILTVEGRVVRRVELSGEDTLFDVDW